VTALYARATGRAVPPREFAWARAFNMFRQACICQGIAARVAARQASSDEARKYADAIVPLAELAWKFTEEVMNGGNDEAARARL
jgi:aminoglycoside phosphotransferase (APT) family kinase protein